MAAVQNLSHSHSTPQLSKSTSDASSMLSPRSDLDPLNTIPDPRAVSSSSTSSKTDSPDLAHHPDLSDEVANLSAKLVSSINHQTRLDDNLQAANHELEQARERLVRLEAEASRRDEQIKSMIQKDVYDKMEVQLRAELAEERKQRIYNEKEKKRIEAELETLTTALFEEANTMVASARRETEASERRSDQLRNQIKDTELLLASHQEQLQDLKAVMEKITADRDEVDSNAHVSTAPSTPGASHVDKTSRIFETNHLSPYSPSEHDITPEHPLRFSHLVHPVLRNDLPAYRDFTDLLKVARLLSTSAPSSRVSSGHYGGLGVLGIGSYVTSPSLTSSSAQQQNASTTSLPTSGPTATHANGSPRAGTTMPALKENAFYKRALAEDIDPTLRLDIAPGISWMARRTVINSMTAGSLVIEPHPPAQKHRGPIFPCSLCGESRVGEKYTRKYRFRTSENDDAQRYPLCDFCLNRMRSTCDYIGFIRLLRDGHWRAETEEEMKSAWEESVRLRERMFWARLGGGVIPAFVQSPRIPEESAKPKDRISEDSSLGPMARNLDGKDDPFEIKNRQDGEKTVTPLRPISSKVPNPATAVVGGDISPLTPQSQDSGNDDELASEQLRSEAHHGSKDDDRSAPSTLTPPTSPQAPPSEKRERDLGLSIVVPASVA